MHYDVDVNFNYASEMPMNFLNFFLGQLSRKFCLFSNSISSARSILRRAPGSLLNFYLFVYVKKCCP